VLTLRGVTRAYAETLVLEGCDLLVERGDKIALVGPNGAGKSTLLRLLARAERPDRGSIIYGEAVEPSYFAQHQAEALTPTNTVLDEVYGAARYGTTTTQVRTLLGRLLFRQDEVFKRVADLSGGERSRVALAKMLLRPANLLLLDEPTNHLDVPAKEVVEEALREFAGTVIVASHDRYFLDQFVNKTVEASGTKLRAFPGNYTFYRERKTLEASAQQSAPVARPAPSPRPEPKAQSARKPRVSDAEREVARLEARIAEFEARLHTLSEELSSPETYAGGRDPSATLAEYEAVNARLADLHSRWDALVASM
jgi:ATP-binding cassette subfamily F protein 3